MNLENTKVYTKDLEVVRKYAQLCGKKVPCLPNHKHIGVAMWAGSRYFDFFISGSSVDTDSCEKEITPDQINALYAEKFGNHSELPNSSEWDGEGLPPVGVECELKYKHASNANWRECKVFAYSSEHGAVAAVWHLDSGIWYHNTIETSDYEFRKPETPEQRKERERLEAAYDLFVEWQRDDEFDPERLKSFEDFKRDSRTASDWLRVVEKTGYRKQKGGE